MEDIWTIVKKRNRESTSTLNSSLSVRSPVNKKPCSSTASTHAPTAGDVNKYSPLGRHVSGLDRQDDSESEDDIDIDSPNRSTEMLAFLVKSMKGLKRILNISERK